MQRILRPRKKSNSVTPPLEIKTKSETRKKTPKKPPLDDWKLFRKIEKECAPHKPRTSSPYSENYAASLAWRADDVKPLFDNEKKPEALLPLCQDLILEHAARRVDLFFYVLVAYYKTEKPPILGWTKLQHGRGKINFKTRAGVTHAAHSSMATTIIDKTILDKTPIESKLEKSNLKIKTSMLCATHFMDSLNSTIELPVFVNDFDFLLEFIRKGRDDSSKIIRDVSHGKITPLEGLLQFLLMMRKIFDEMLENEEIYPTKLNISVKTKKDLVQLEKKGTLINKLGKDEKSVNDEYIYMLLRLKPDEVAKCKSNANAKEKIIGEKIEEIQQEIITTPSAHVRVNHSL